MQSLLKCDDGRQLVQGSIGKALLKLSLPVALSNLVSTAYQFVNTFWLGRLGAQAVAAVSMSFPVIALAMSLGSGLAGAGSILVAQYAGARDQHGVERLTLHALLMVTITSVVLSTVGWMLTPLVLHLMNIAPEAFDETARYLHVSLIGIPLAFLTATFQAVLCSTGEVKIPLYFTVGSVVTNLLLDPVLIFGLAHMPRLGVSGAAYATLLSQALASFASFWLLVRHGGVALSARSLVLEPELIKRLTLLSLPTSVEQSVQGLGMMLITIFVSHFGTTVIAAYGISFRLAVLVIIPAFAISTATSTIVGQSLGAGESVRARRVAAVGAWHAFWVLSVTSIGIYAFAGHIVHFFVPNDHTIDADGTLAIRLMATSFGLLGLQMTLAGAFRASGDTLTPMFFGLLWMWGMRVPLTFWLSRHTSLGEAGLWYAFPIATSVVAALTLIEFKRKPLKRLVMAASARGAST